MNYLKEAFYNYLEFANKEILREFLKENDIFVNKSLQKISLKYFFNFYRKSAKKIYEMVLL